MDHPRVLTPESLTAHTTWVRRLARQLVDDPHLADDLAQSACVAAIQKPPRETNLRGWFDRVLRNLVRQGRRSDHRRWNREQRAAVFDTAPSSADLAERLQMHRRVVDAVQDLGEPYKSVILLRYFQDLPPREIARMRNAPVATVNSQLARGLAKLRERLDERYGDRHAWSLPLISWAMPRPSVVATGAYAMKTKAILVLLAASLVGWAVFQIGWGGGAEPSREVQAASGEGMQSSAPVATRTPAAPEVTRTAIASPPPEPEVPMFRGKVVDVGGNTLADIGVRWRSEPDGEIAMTDAAGGFSMPVPDSPRRVVVQDPGLATVLAAHVGPDVQSYAGDPVVVAAPALSLAGRVVDETGAPVADAEISCRLPGDFETRLPLALDLSHRPPWNAITGDEGRFRLPELAAVDGASVYARKQGFLPLNVPLPASSTTDLVLTLRRPQPSEGSLQGQVLDPEGLPVPEAIVSLGRAQALTDVGGMFTLPLRTSYGRTDLKAMKPGYLPAQKVLTATPLPSDFVYLQMPGETRSISGRVVDAAGAPVPGARVWAEDATSFILEDGIGAIEGYLAGKPSENDLRRGIQGEATRERVDELWESSSNALWGWGETDAQGRFELGGLLDRPYRLGAMRRDSLARVVSEPYPAGSVEAIIAFPADAVLPRVAGVVVGHDGAPVEGVEVRPILWPLMVSYVDDRADFITGVSQTRAASRTDAEGRFEFRDLGRFVQFDVEGDAILPVRYGDHQQDLLDGQWPVDALRIEVSRRVRLRIELSDPGRADNFRAFDRWGARRLLHKFSGSIQGRLTNLPITSGRSEVCGVAEDATTIAFFLGEQEVGRIDVELLLDEINVVRW